MLDVKHDENRKKTRRAKMKILQQLLNDEDVYESLKEQIREYQKVEADFFEGKVIIKVPNFNWEPIIWKSRN